MERQLQMLDTDERHVLIQGGSTGRYVASGYLVYFRHGTRLLMAAPFDLSRLSVTGPAVPLEERTFDALAGAYAVSDQGLLAYVPGNPRTYDRRLVWVDRTGTVEPLPAPVRPYSELSISPDGRSAAVQIFGSTHGVWLHDFSRNTLTPVSGVDSEGPVRWTPDSKRVFYQASRRGMWGMYWKSIDGTGEEEALAPSESVLRAAWSLTPDGKWMAFQEHYTESDIGLLSLQGERKTQVFMKTPSWEWGISFSPDGKWLAYSSDESNRFEVYVQPFPGPGPRHQISTEGGRLPLWSRDGREWFYVNGRRVMAVPITTPVFRAGAPRLLFEHRTLPDPRGPFPYDISPDGRRFLMVQSIEPEEAPSQINIVINWFEELKRLAPAK